MNEQLGKLRRDLDGLLVWADAVMGGEYDRQCLLEELLTRIASLSAEIVEKTFAPSPDVQAFSDGGSTFVNVRKGHGHVGMQIGVIHGDAVFGTVRPSDVDGGW